jgi:hypothetical protein
LFLVAFCIAIIRRLFLKVSVLEEKVWNLPVPDKYSLYCCQGLILHIRTGRFKQHKAVIMKLI